MVQLTPQPGEAPMRDAVIVGAVRTAVGRRNGRLSPVRPDDLAAHVLRELVTRVGIDASEVEDVILGCVDQLGEQGFNIARNAALIAGFPVDVCGTTLDRMCGSGQQAANFAAMGVMAGQYEVVIAGAAALMFMSRERATALGIRPRARVVATALAGVDPTIMLTGPIPATQRALRKAALALDAIDLCEINEAFASVVLAWERELHPDMSRVNVNGGAIALGHPLGCSGARLMTTLLHELERTGQRYGLQTMCIGFGQGIATVLERL